MSIEAIILEKISQNGSVTPAEIQKHAGFSRMQIHRVTSRLMREGKIVRLGATRNLRFAAPTNEFQAAIEPRPLSFPRRIQLAYLDESLTFREISQETNVLE